MGMEMDITGLSEETTKRKETKTGNTEIEAAAIFVECSCVVCFGGRVSVCMH